MDRASCRYKICTTRRCDRWAACRHMPRPQVSDGEDNLHIQREVIKIVDLSWTAGKGWYSGFQIVRGDPTVKSMSRNVAAGFGLSGLRRTR